MSDKPDDRLPTLHKALVAVLPMVLAMLLITIELPEPWELLLASGAAIGFLVYYRWLKRQYPGRRVEEPLGRPGKPEFPAAAQLGAIMAVGILAGFALIWWLAP